MSLDLLGVAKIELDLMSEFQSEIHDPDSPNELIPTKFNTTFRKTSFSVKYLEKLETLGDKEDKKFLVNSKFSYLMKSYIMSRIPALEVKDEFKGRIQICWTRNLAHNRIKYGKLNFDDQPAQAIDSVWLDMRSQFNNNGNGNKHEMYQIMVGNVDFLVNWQEFLPAFTIYTIPEFFYSKHLSYALPLFLCSKSRVSHDIKFNDSILNLLRMRTRPDDSHPWVIGKTNLEYIEGSLKDFEKLPDPEMWGYYSLVNPTEIDWLKDETKKNPKVIYADDIIMKDEEKTCYLGLPHTVKLQSENPIKGIYYVAENQVAKNYNCHSNYTANSSDIMSGWAPISRVKILYGTNVRIPEVESSQIERPESYLWHQSSPCEPGYGGFLFAYDLNYIHADVSTSIKQRNAEITFMMENTDPFLSRSLIKKEKDKYEKSRILLKTESEVKNQGDPYIIKVRMLTYKKVIFQDGAKVEIVSEKPIDNK